MPYPKGKPCSEETKLKIAAKLKGRPSPMKGRVGWCKGKKLPPLSDEQKRKISEALKGKPKPTLQGRIPWNKGKRCSEETRKKISDARRNLTDEQRKRISETSKGRKAWNKGLKGIFKASEETKRKMSESRKGLFAGEKHPMWKGGLRLRNARHYHERKRRLGFNPLNPPFDRSVGHHINQDQVIYIPEEVHKKYRHRLNRPETMIEINQIALLYLMDIYTY